MIEVLVRYVQGYQPILILDHINKTGDFCYETINPDGRLIYQMYYQQDKIPHILKFVKIIEYIP